jgi:hypothetical protein
MNNKAILKKVSEFRVSKRVRFTMDCPGMEPRPPWLEAAD